MRKRCRLCLDDRPAQADELCVVHYNRRRRGMPNWADPIKRRSGEAWSRKGYRVLYMPSHPNAGKGNGTVFEHVVVMSEHLGRALLAHERCHHKNGNRSDNRIENLELWSVSQPPGQRIEDKVIWAKEILALYGEMEMA